METYLIILSVVVLLAILIVCVFVVFRKNPSLVSESYKSLVTDLGENRKYNQEVMKDMREDLNRIRVEHDKEKMELRGEIALLIISREKDHKIIKELERRILLFETEENDKPYAYWLKDLNGRMVLLNDRYEEFFLKGSGRSKEEYRRKTDMEFWGQEIGGVYHENDMKIIRGETNFFVGIEPILVAGTHVSQNFLIIKHPKKYRNELVGVEGMAIPIADNSFISKKGHSKVLNFMLEQGDIKAAVNALANALGEDEQDAVLMLKARLNRLLSQEKKKTIDTREAELERNQIMDAIISMMSE